MMKLKIFIQKIYDRDTYGPLGDDRDINGPLPVHSYNSYETACDHYDDNDIPTISINDKMV